MKKQICLVFAGSVIAVAGIMAQPPGPNHPPGPPNAEERVQHVSEKFEKELKLTTGQKEKLAAAYKAFFLDMDKLRSKDGKTFEPPPPPPPPPVNKEAAEKLSTSRDAQIKTILSAAQYVKYTALEKTMRPPMPGNKPVAPMPPPNERKE